MKNFLLKCNFLDSDIVLKQEATIEELKSEFDKLFKACKSAKTKGHLLCFVYFSGHGSVNSTGQTCGHCLDGKVFEIEKQMRDLSSYPSVALIGFMDCCRTDQTKNQTQVKLPGQLALIFSNPAGQASFDFVGQLSPVTRSFIDTMTKSGKNFNESLSEWSRNHQSAEVIEKLKYDIQLVPNEVITKIPNAKSKPLKTWTPGDLQEWMRSLNLRNEVDYIKNISLHQFDGLTLIEIYDGGKIDQQYCFETIMITNNNTSADFLSFKRYLIKLMDSQKVLQ